MGQEATNRGLGMDDAMGGNGIIVYFSSWFFMFLFFFFNSNFMHFHCDKRTKDKLRSGRTGRWEGKGEKDEANQGLK